MDVVEKYGLEVFGFLASRHAHHFLDQDLGEGRRFLNVEIAAALLGCTVAPRSVLIGGLNHVRQPKVLHYLEAYEQARDAMIVRLPGKSRWSGTNSAIWPTADWRKPSLGSLPVS